MWCEAWGVWSWGVWGVGCEVYGACGVGSYLNFKFRTIITETVLATFQKSCLEFVGVGRPVWAPTPERRSPTPPNAPPLPGTSPPGVMRVPPGDPRRWALFLSPHPLASGCEPPGDARKSLSPPPPPSAMLSPRRPCRAAPLTRQVMRAMRGVLRGTPVCETQPADVSPSLPLLPPSVLLSVCPAHLTRQVMSLAAGPRGPLTLGTRSRLET